MDARRSRSVWLVGATALLACGGRAQIDQAGASSANSGATSLASGAAMAANGGSDFRVGTGGSAGEGGSLHGRIATFELATDQLAIYPPNPEAGSAALSHISGPFGQEGCPDLAFDAGANLYLLCHEQGFPADPAHVEVFAPDAAGEAVPTRRISGPDTTLLENNMLRLAVDSAGSVYVLQVNFAAYPGIGSISVFAPDARDDASPIRTLILPGNELSTANALALDPRGQVFVGYSHSTLVRVFAANASGTPAPIRAFGAPSSDASIVDLAVDANGFSYVLSESYTVAEVRIYGPEADGDQPPLRVVTLDAAAQNAGIDVASDGRMLLATNGGVAIFAANASGAPKPILTFGTGAKNAVAIAP